MAHIKITKGLDIPIKGRPEGHIQPLVPSGSAEAYRPSHIALDLKPFEEVKFKVLVKQGDIVQIGQPLAEDKSVPGRMFCSPAGGTVSEVRRGLKRALLAIVIEVANEEKYVDFPRIDAETASRNEMIDLLKLAGIFTLIRSRPFNLLADPNKKPRNIFVKAVESAPFAPPAELQVENYEKEFQLGLDILAKLTDGKVHLVHRKECDFKAFTEAKNVERHTVEGPHPVSNYSLHIQNIDPVRSPDDLIWTLNAHDVVSIGYLFTHHRTLVERVISIAGPGVLPDRVGYFKGRAGLSINGLVSGRIARGEPLRFISGDPLIGRKVEIEDFLGFYDYVFCVIPESTERELLHFFRLGKDKFTFSRAYLSGHFDHARKEYDFTTNQHGEHRAFIDSSLADDVMPLPVLPMLLVKAVMAEDFELAEKLGILSVDSEDFALPAFVCMSKVEMVDIMKNGIKQYAQDMLA